MYGIMGWCWYEGRVRCRLFSSNARMSGRSARGLATPRRGDTATSLSILRLPDSPSFSLSLSLANLWGMHAPQQMLLVHDSNLHLRYTPKPSSSPS